MAAAITWLDASSEDQRRMQDIIRLFEQRDSRDELGLSQFRDAFSDGLFPGTSTLLTRARYFLFISWAFSMAEGKPNSSVRARRNEWATIDALQGSDDKAGLLGAEAGRALKRLPSSVYWPAMVTHGIVSDAPDNSDPNTPHVWHPGLPEASEGFPNSIPEGFAMEFEEASWLRERMASNAPDMLLTHLLYNPPGIESKAPWEDAVAQRAQGQAKKRLDLAATFSEVMHGAQLLYNVMLAEEYESYGLRGASYPADGYSGRLAEWVDRVSTDYRPSEDLAYEICAEVDGIRTRPVNKFSFKFVREWFSLVADADPSDVINYPEARELVARREKFAKGGQARLGNKKRLSTWGGASGAGRLTYRWTQAQQMILDIHEGLAREGGEAVA